MRNMLKKLKEDVSSRSLDRYLDKNTLNFLDRLYVKILVTSYKNKLTNVKLHLVQFARTNAI